MVKQAVGTWRIALHHLLLLNRLAGMDLEAQLRAKGAKVGRRRWRVRSTARVRVCILEAGGWVCEPDIRSKPGAAGEDEESGWLSNGWVIEREGDGRDQDVAVIMAQAVR